MAPLPMTPHVWLFRQDAATIRIIQRVYDGRAEVVVLGSEGLRKHQLFETPLDAERFRGVLVTELLATGFELTWTNASPAS